MHMHMHAHVCLCGKTKVISQQLPTAARPAARPMCVGLKAVGGVRSDHHIDSAAAQRSPDGLPEAIGPNTARHRSGRPLLGVPSAVLLGVIPAPRMLLGGIRGAVVGLRSPRRCRPECCRLRRLQRCPAAFRWV